MQASRCRTVWDKGGVVHALTVHFSDHRVTEIAAASGWDCLWIDLEHSPRTERELELMCMAARAGGARTPAGPPDIMARPGRGEFMRLGRLLEAGATGILYPRCESVDEAKEAVRWCKFAPIGERAFDGGNADNHFGSYPASDYVSHANQRVWLAVQIESPAALDHVEAIARVPGVDLLFFGPGDFSCLSGVPGQLTAPVVVDAMLRTAAACKSAGIRFGTLSLTESSRKVAVDAGCQLLGIGADQGLLSGAMNEYRQRLAKEVAR